MNTNEVRREIWAALEGVAFWARHLDDSAVDLVSIQASIEQAVRVVKSVRAEFGDILPPAK